MTNLIKFSGVVVLVAGLSGCGASSNSTNISSSDDDYSASGAAASSIGAAVSSSSQNGTFAFNGNQSASRVARLTSLALPSVLAGGACPKATTAAGAGCATSGNAINMTYASCSFGTAAATWTGVLQLSLQSGAALACGAWPAPVSTSLQRQFVDGSNNPSFVTRTSAKGTVATIDHGTANLGNYQGDVISAITNGGYGSRVTFNGAGQRTGVTVAQRIYTSNWDHSVSGTVSLSESGSSRTVSGSVITYHNKLKVKGTATFTSVVYNDTCCLPVSGTVSTAFSSTSQSGIAGNALNGKSESLTFTSCGVGSFTDAAGSVSTVTMNQCL